MLVNTVPRSDEHETFVLPHMREPLEHGRAGIGLASGLRRLG